jgi:hypothetical protein
VRMPRADSAVVSAAWLLPVLQAVFLVVGNALGPESAPHGSLDFLKLRQRDSIQEESGADDKAHRPGKYCECLTLVHFVINTRSAFQLRAPQNLSRLPTQELVSAQRVASPEGN